MFSWLFLKMELNISVSPDLNIDFIKLQKMSFLYNALDAGWTVKKQEQKYIFTKKHEGKKEVYLETYLQKFIEANLSANRS
jgi:hypothetical protein